MNKKDKILFTQPSTVSWAERRDISMAILGWLAIISIFFWVLSHLTQPLLLLLIAAFLAYALAPAVRFLTGFIPRFLAIILIYLFVLIGLGVVIYLVVTTGTAQFASLVSNINALLSPAGGQPSPLSQTLNNFGISRQQIAVATNQLSGQADKLTGSVIPLLTSIFTSILNTLLVAVLSIYLLIDGESIINWLKNNIPSAQQGRFQFLLNSLKRVVGGYIRGQFILAAIVGLLVGVGMAILKVPYPVLLGILAFVLEFIPILGTLVSGAICILIAITQGWLVALFVTVYFILVHIMEGDILGPKIVGKALGLHPLVSILALIAGSEVFGIIGALFAAPVAGICQAFLVAIWTEWRAAHNKDFAPEKNVAGN